MSTDRKTLQKHRINRVLNHIRNDLTSDLNLEPMAEVAKLSKFHFTRVFTNLLHETPNQYVTRLRLEKAAKHFIRAEDSNITQIALRCGFSGSDTFSRSFRQRFHCAPRVFKQLNERVTESTHFNQDIQIAIYKPGSSLSNDLTRGFRVNIEHRPEYHIAYMRHFGPYGDLGNSITNTFTHLQQWADQQGLLNKRSSFLGSAKDFCSITPAKQCMYDIGFVLEDNIQEDHTVSVQTVPAGTFAVLEVICESPQLNRYWDWLSTVWLPQSGFAAAARASYEFFPERGKAYVHSSRGIQLCLPLTISHH